MDYILEKWQHPVHRGMMPERCREASDQGKRIGVKEDGTYYVVGEAVHEKDDDSCPDCGGDCYTIGEFKECKDCSGLFKKDKRVTMGRLR